MCFSMSMESAPFNTALTPIYSRSHAVRSSGRVASRYPRSSTPLRNTNPLSSTNSQQLAVKIKSSLPVDTTVNSARKRKVHTDGNGIKEKVRKRAVSTAAAHKDDKVKASTVSGHYRFIGSLAGELQKQKREEMV